MLEARRAAEECQGQTGPVEALSAAHGKAPSGGKGRNTFGLCLFVEKPLKQLCRRVCTAAACGADVEVGPLRSGVG